MKTYFETLSRFNYPLPITDYLAKVLVNAVNLPSNDPESRLLGAGSVKLDLNLDGTFRSTKKTFLVKDKNGYTYKVTIEQDNI